MDGNRGDDVARGPRGTAVLGDAGAAVPAHQAETVVPAHERVTIVRPDGSQDPRPGEQARPAPVGERSAQERAAPRHQLLKVLGKGGMGEVHVALDPELRRKVAFKRLLPELVDNQGMAARFLTEVQVTAQLDHPNVVPVHGFELAEDGTLGYSMKLIKGRDLSKLVEKWRAEAPRYTRAEAIRRLASRLDIFLRICEAMTYAHGKGVLHRDLKPENVMVGLHNDVYVMDWGIFRLIGDPGDEERVTMTAEAAEAAGHGKTVDGMVLGTPAYMSPEQANGWVSALDERSDVFTLGVILAELITLRPARPSDTLEQAVTLARAGHVAPMVPIRARLRIPRELRAIVARATQVEASARYPSVRELADDVRRFLRGEGVTARPDNPVQALARWLGRHRMVALVTILALLAVGGVVVAWQVRARSRAEEAVLRRQALHRSLAAAVARQGHALDTDFSHWEVAAARLVGRASEVVSAPARPAPTPAPAPAPAPPPAPGPSYYDVDAFDHEQVPGLVDSPRYGRKISVVHPVVQIASRTSAAAVQDEAERVVGLAHSLRNALVATTPGAAGRPSEEELLKLLGDDGVPALRTFVTLASGVHVSFPGYGGYPPSYDGTERKKYTSTTKQDNGAHRVYWGEPFSDRHALGLVLPIGGVLFDRGEHGLGVAGLELSLAWVASHRLVMDGAWADEVALLDASGQVIVRVPRGQPPIFAETTAAGEDGDLVRVDFDHARARAAAGADEASIVELPDGRLAALYPLSVIDYTFVVLADPRRM